jgi:hypothetical protein
MFIKVLKVLFVAFSLLMIFYLALPNFSFPEPPPGSVQSQEPADLESPLRRGYFTNFTRAEVLAWYEAQFNHSSVLGIKLPTILLNYPPEEAQTLIRDQTGSTFLQEYVHPFREGLFINGFQPKTLGNQPHFYAEGNYYQLKIIIRYVPSSIWVREGVFILTAAMIIVVYRGFRETLRRKK